MTTEPIAKETVETSLPAAASRTSSTYEDKVIHTYDGIEEYDNHLPNWWLYTLYGAVIFALGYFVYYEVLKIGPNQMAEYNLSMQADRRAAAERARRAGSVTATSLIALSRDTSTVTQGRTVFTQNCVACHRADGGGNIGPNLTDDRWLHGGSPTQIFHTVAEGVPEKGMPAWGAPLGDERTQAVVAFLLSVRNTNVAGGKAPQGEAYAGE